MGIIKWFKDKWNQSWTYIVTEEILREYLCREIQFSIKENLEASADLNIYLKGEKHHIQMWNYSASADRNEQSKGLVIYFDEKEYADIDELMDNQLGCLPEHFKVELTMGDDNFLNEYKASHPELREADY